MPGEECYVSPAVHCRGTIPDRGPDCPRPVGEHPEYMSEVTGDFDGNRVDRT